MLDIDAALEQARMADGKRMSDARIEQVTNLVLPKPDWKDEIHAFVDKDAATREEIETAVTWTCGGLPDVADRGDRWEVLGAGYWGWM